jgi:hypothetical protein
MAFTDFKYPTVLTELALTLDNADDLFAGVAPVPLSAAFHQQLQMTGRLAVTINTEKSRSEWLVAPVLAAFWERYHGRIGLYSGTNFSGDPDAGLSGYCDYVITRAPQQFVIDPPVLVAFEGKNESIPNGLGQCVAAMVGAQRFNRRHNAPSDPIYGCVTTGTAWRFLRLSGSTVTLDLREYGIGEADLLLGVLTHIVGPPPAQAAA